MKTIDHKTGQLRYNLLRDTWALIAPQRRKQPQDFIAENKHDQSQQFPESFADPSTHDAAQDVLQYQDNAGEWTTRVFAHDAPAVEPEGEMLDMSEGPYPAMRACGRAEVVVTRDVERPFALLEIDEIAEVLDAYQERYLALMSARHVRHIMIFHNHGKDAAASAAHPHSQIMTLPVVPPEISQELTAAQQYFKKNRKHLMTTMLDHEIEHGKRIVFENEHFVVYCPFASSRAYEMRIVPRKRQPYFERITPAHRTALAQALKVACGALYRGLDDVAFNFYLRTAPCSGEDYRYYGYHIDLLPRTHVYAGFELGADVPIVPVAPEEAAAYLRQHILEQE